MKRGFMDGYKTYDPNKEGFGDSREWRSAFKQRMTMDEARDIFRGLKQTPAEILGVSERASASEIQKAYRAKAVQCHPDRCHVHGMTEAAATEAFKQLSAAYTLLRERRR